MVQSTTVLDSHVEFINNWNLSKFDTGQREDGNDDHWGSSEWESYVAETREPEKDLTNKVHASV